MKILTVSKSTIFGGDGWKFMLL